MARVELPESRLKLRKRRMYRRVALLCVVVLVLLGAALVGVSYIPALRVDTVVVHGVQTLATSSVEYEVQQALSGNYAFILPRDNIFLYPRQYLATKLVRNYPVLGSVDVHAADFHTVVVNLVERQPRALWCLDEPHCFFMDESGMIYAPAPTFSTAVYVSYFGTTTHGEYFWRFLTPEQFPTLSALVDALAQKVPTEKVLQVVVDANSDVSVVFAESFTLKFGLHDQGGDVFERFSLALTSAVISAHKLSDFDYIDLRFGDKLYYKLK